MKITTDKLLVLIIYLGFTSITSIATLQDLQTDAVAHKGFRIASIGAALFLSFIVFCVRNPLRFLTAKTLFLFFLYFCSVCMTALWSAIPSLTAFKSLELLLLIFIGLIGLSLKTTEPQDLFNWVITIFIVQTAIIWIEALVFPDLAFKQIRGTTPFLSGMLKGVYPTVNPNTVGFLGGIIAVTLLPKVLGDKKLMRIENLFFVLGMMAVIASYSRGALLATGVVVLAYSVYSRNFKISIFIIALLLALLLSGKYTVILQHIERGRESVDIATLSSGRTDIWQAVLQDYTQYIFGQGYAVGFRYNRLLGQGNAHNSIFEILTGAGVVGVLSWLFLFYTLFISLYAFQTKRRLINSDFSGVINAQLYLFISTFTNVRGVYLDMGTLLLISIIVYVEKTRLIFSKVQRQTRQILPD